MHVTLCSSGATWVKENSAYAFVELLKAGFKLHLFIFFFFFFLVRDWFCAATDMKGDAFCFASVP